MKLDKSQTSTLSQSNSLSVFVNTHVNTHCQKRLQVWQQAYPQLSAANEQTNPTSLTQTPDAIYVALDHFMYQFGLC